MHAYDLNRSIYTVGFLDFLFWFVLPYVTQESFRPEICLPGRISAGFLSGKLQHRPSGWPKAGRRPDFEAFPIRIRPKSGPEDRSPPRKHYCVTSGN